MPTPTTRRGFVAAAAATAAAINVRGQDASTATDNAAASSGATGRLNQGVCGWCYNGKLSLDELAAEASRLNLVGIDLVDIKDFGVLKSHGLVGTMTPSHPLPNGLCDPQHHASSIEAIHAAIEATAAEGWKNVICFSGNARGIDRETGMANCVTALKEVVPAAEKAGVTLCMELLNSRVNHPDYMCDKSEWGVELCKRVGSDRFRLLYDIYHMQIMEGDIIRTIERDHEFFAHYHTAGNPGRNELNDTQELFYPPIARAIADTGFDGYLSHEFIPVGDPVAGLEQAVEVCNV